MPTIMIVDDNFTVLTVMQAMLEKDYQVILCKSGRQALSVCEKRRPDLIYLDIEMPGMDGFEVLCRLKGHEDESLRLIPVIFCSATRDNQTEARALTAGAADFIIKPPEQSILMYRTQMHLKLSGAA